MIFLDKPETVDYLCISEGSIRIELPLPLFPKQVCVIVHSHLAVAKAICAESCEVRLWPSEGLMPLRSPCITSYDVNCVGWVCGGLSSLVLVYIIHPLVIVLVSC